jgi:hypothetical protein
MMELEELLTCPREHLECAIWFLREMSFITRGDNGRFSITVKGFEEAENSGIVGNARPDRLLTTATAASASEEFEHDLVARA